MKERDRERERQRERERKRKEEIARQRELREWCGGKGRSREPGRFGGLGVPGARVTYSRIRGVCSGAPCILWTAGSTYGVHSSTRGAVVAGAVGALVAGAASLSSFKTSLLAGVCLHGVLLFR